MQPKIVVGQIGEVVFPELSNITAEARIDTGAQTSAIWASSVTETPEGLAVIFFDRSMPQYTGEPVLIEEYSETIVVSSNGIKEHRYKIRLLCVFAGRRIRGWFTLADRSRQRYPILLGRNILRGKFVVDVAVEATAQLPHNKSEAVLPVKKQEV